MLVVLGLFHSLTVVVVLAKRPDAVVCPSCYRLKEACKDHVAMPKIAGSHE